MKRLPYLLICIVLASVLLTAGCLEDLSSTLPPCCDGTCNMTKTSVITLEEHWGALPGPHYIRDFDGELYTWVGDAPAPEIRSHNNHNVTFSYTMVDGHRHITGIIEDRDAKECDCCQCFIKCDSCRG